MARSRGKITWQKWMEIQEKKRLREWLSKEHSHRVKVEKQSMNVLYAILTLVGIGLIIYDLVR